MEENALQKALDQLDQAVAAVRFAVQDAANAPGAADAAESKLRLALHDAGLPRPETDIQLGVWPWSARISLGWRRFKVGIHFESDPPPTDRTLINLAAAEAERRAIHGWLILTATPQRDVGQLVNSVRQALRQARARTPG